MTGMSSGHCAQREPAVGVSRRRVESERHPISPAAKILDLGREAAARPGVMGLRGFFRAVWKSQSGWYRERVFSSLNGKGAFFIGHCKRREEHEHYFGQRAARAVFEVF